MSGTSIFLLGEYWSSKTYFWRLRKNFWIRRGQEIIDLLKIDFNGLWSLITINLQPYKYSWKRSTPKTIERFSFSACSYHVTFCMFLSCLNGWVFVYVVVGLSFLFYLCTTFLVVPQNLWWIANRVPLCKSTVP